MLSGTAAVAFDDRRVVEPRPSGLFYLPLVLQDSRVIGREPYVSLHFHGAEQYDR